MEANQIFFFKNQEKRNSDFKCNQISLRAAKNFRKIQENCADSKCNEISLMEQKGYQKKFKKTSGKHNLNKLCSFSEQ